MRLHYGDMKRGHCQDGKNTSAAFYLFPQHWDWDVGGLNCVKKDCVCVGGYACVCVCERESDIQAGVYYTVCLWVCMHENVSVNVTHIKEY